MTRSKSIDVILIEESYLLRTGLSILLIEEFEKVYVYEDVGDFESFLSMLETTGNCCIIINIDKLNNYKRYLHRVPEHAVIIPLHGNSQLKELLSQYRYSINLYEDKKSITETIQRAIESLNNKVKSDISLDNLTQKEQFVLQLIAKGYPSKKIADYLGISLHTVLTHRKNISRKLEIKSVSGLTAFAILNHLIRIEDAKII